MVMRGTSRSDENHCVSQYFQAPLAAHFYGCRMYRGAAAVDGILTFLTRRVRRLALFAASCLLAPLAAFFLLLPLPLAPQAALFLPHRNTLRGATGCLTLRCWVHRHEVLCRSRHIDMPLHAWPSVESICDTEQHRCASSSSCRHS